MVCRLFFLCLILFVSNNLLAQRLQQIHVKKQSNSFLFFQKGKASDTIINGKTNLFYLLIADSLKELLVIETKQAQLIQNENDSLVTLKYLPGINYLHKFLPKEDNLVPLNNKQKNKLHLVPFINGANETNSHKIQIQFLEKQSGKIMAEFNYVGLAP